MGTNTALTTTTELESSPIFGKKESDVYFVRSNNLFSLNLDTGQLNQHTDIRSAGSDIQVPSTSARGGRGALGDQADRGTESQEWVKKEERDLWTPSGVGLIDASKMSRAAVKNKLESLLCYPRPRLLGR